MNKKVKIIAMIPARMGSQRLKHKNLRKINGIPLITHAIRIAKKSGVFNEIWVNSESNILGQIALNEGVLFHKRPDILANNTATSEDFVCEFIKSHECDYLIQVHTISPLLSPSQISDFVNEMLAKKYNTLLSVVHEQIECAFKDSPVNFSFNLKTNSQELIPIQRITWSITGWKRDTYLRAYEGNKCATYSGVVGFYPISRKAGHIIKTEEDFQIAEALLQSVKL